MRHRVAFYPCCALDIRRPLELLHDYVDEVVFCDINASLLRRWKRIVSVETAIGPRPSFLIADVRKAISQVAVINILFYRRDSLGEGGSGVFVLGDSFLPHILRRFPAEGGLIITDGSNSRGGNFNRMIRPSGMCKHGWLFTKSCNQPYIETDRLHVITVGPAGADGGATATLGRPALISAKASCPLAPGEAHISSERAGLDDEVVDRAAVAEDPVPVPQCPIDRGAAIEADIEPLVKPAHQGRAELAPLAGLTAVEHQPAAAAAPAERLVLEHGTALTLRDPGAGQRVKSAKPVIAEPQGAVFDIEHQTAGNVADRKQYALVVGTVPEARDDLEIAVADQRRDHPAMHGLRVRQKSSPAGGRRTQAP